MMSSVNPKELYLRIVTQRGTRTLCHDIVVCCGEEELTDELCERTRLEIIACLQEELPPDEKIISSEYVSKDSLTPAIRDNDKVVQWRTMDFLAYGLSYAFDGDGAAGNLGARLTAKVDQSDKGIALGKEVVDNQHLIVFV